MPPTDEQRAKWRERYRWRLANEPGFKEKRAAEAVAWRLKDPVVTASKRKESYRRRRAAKGLPSKRIGKGTQNARILRNFGIGIEEYEAMLSVVPGCAICGTPDPGMGRKYFSVDHDHATGRVRGLLCGKCNLGLGLLGDTTDALRRASEYLGGA